MADSLSELIQNEHKRIERIIKAVDPKSFGKVWIPLVQASNGLRCAAMSMKKYEEEDDDEDDEHN